MILLFEIVVFYVEQHSVVLNLHIHIPEPFWDHTSAFDVLLIMEYVHYNNLSLKKIEQDNAGHV